MRAGRFGRWISQAISLLAPPLHSLHWKVFLLCLVAIFLPGMYLAWKVGQGIERGHLRSTEAGMIDTALIVAESFSARPAAGLPVASEIRRRVFRDEDPNLRVVLYDASGRVLSDSSGFWKAGSDHSNERDVRLALDGGYGAKWERDPYQRAVVLFSAVPVFRDGRVDGVVRVVKATSEVRRSVIRSLLDLAAPAALAVALAALASYALSTYITRILRHLAGQAEAVAAGRAGVHLETWSKSELGDLARALEKMRLKLEGRAYVENMVTTLSHEIKTPLAAIQGAAEIARSSPDESVRHRFLDNILRETGRLAAIVNNMLALARIESQPVEAAAFCSLREVAGLAAESAARQAETRKVRLETAWPDQDCPVRISADSLRRLLDVLLENAVQFTPDGGTVRMVVEPLALSIRDEGPGIPEAHKNRVFERFFTTPHPVTGRRGTGLGLAIAKSIADRAGAVLSLENHPEGGAEARVIFVG